MMGKINPWVYPYPWPQRIQLRHSVPEIHPETGTKKPPGSGRLPKFQNGFPLPRRKGCGTLNPPGLYYRTGCSGNNRVQSRPVRVPSSHWPQPGPSPAQAATGDESPVLFLQRSCKYQHGQIQCCTHSLEPSWAETPRFLGTPPTIKVGSSPAALSTSASSR